ncbi:MAG: NAD(P)/FAD-dependent oxidoreductase [Thermotogaceae bacterium]|nr:NAD(P)/FAD-dependent oxidoreductase [Thermotogaceae bacterium]
MKAVVIGAGIVGSLVSRELTRYGFDVSIIEKEADVAWGVTKANSGIVHAGYDDEPGTLRAALCAKGNAMYEEISKELDVKVKRTGSLVVAFNNEELETLKELLKRGEINGVPDLKILDRDEVLSMEPHLNPEVKYALYAPTAGVIFPWDAAIAAVENALDNGAKLFLNEKVVDIEVKDGKVRKVITDKGEHKADLVINAAGLYGDEISKMAGAEYVPIHPRKGEYILLDSNVSKMVKRVIFPTPTEKSKGILVVPTLTGEILLGPTAQDLPPEMKDDLSTTAEGLNFVKEKVVKLMPDIPFNMALKTFAGLRPESPQKDFFIKKSNKVWGFVNVIAIRSPGLTAAPAIAKYVIEKVIEEDLGITLEKNESFNPVRKGITHFADLPEEEWNEIIKKDPEAGKIICFCNKVTEREVIEAIKRGAKTLDGIKFRTRAMAGRCQANFCATKVIKLLARELGVDMSEIMLKSGNTWVVDGKVRE